MKLRAPLEVELQDVFSVEKDPRSMVVKVVAKDIAA